MAGLTTLALRSLAARRLRTILTVLGIGLGVAVLFASLVTNVGIDRSIDRTVEDLVGRADLRVAAFQERGLSARTVEAIASTAGVEVAAPSLERRIYLRREVGSLGPLPPPVTVLGIDPRLDPRIRDLRLVAGSPLLRNDESAAVISERLAAADGLALGSELTLDGPGATERFRVVGIVDADGPLVGAAGRSVILPLISAGRVFGTDAVDRVDVRVAAASSAAEVEAALVDRLAAQPYVLSSPRQLGAALRSSTAEFGATTAMIAAIALFVGAFLIFNTLSMTVGERIREVGLLRSAGATRRQVMAFVLAGAGVLGLLGAAVGVAAGLVLAAGMAAYLEAVTTVPFRGLDVPPMAAASAAAVGILVTLAAALEPAWRAGRIAPVEALRPASHPVRGQRARLRGLVAVLAVIGFVGAALSPAGAGGPAGPGPTRSLAVYAILLAAALVSPWLLGPLGRIAGAPFAAVARLEERLARGSLVRDRGRAALTVGALTVGLALIVAIGGVAQQARRAAGTWLEAVVPGDLVLTSIRPVGLDEPVVDDLAAADGVARLTPVATFDLAHRGTRLDAAAVGGGDLLADGRLAFVAGDREAALRALDAGGATVIPASQAERLGLRVGDTLTVAIGRGRVLDLEVVGVVERAFAGQAGETVLVGWPDAERYLGVAGADFFAVRLTGAADAGQRAALEAAARQAALEPATLDRIQGAITDAIGRVFGLFDALALVAVVVAALGTVNTLTMNVVERVREIGILRAAGMSRRQVGRMVVVEAGIVGAVGAVLGAGAGVVAGTAMVLLAGGRLDGPVVPWAAVTLCVGLGLGLSMAAAWYPARVAGRLSIIRAVGFE